METIQGIEVKPTKPWPFSERSTRNCCHCKTYNSDGKAKVYCSKGKCLSRGYPHDGRYGISLSVVLKSARWASEACQSCEYFEHDIEGGDK